MSREELWIPFAGPHGEEWVRASVVSSGVSGVVVIDPAGNKVTLRPDAVGPFVDESHLQDHDDICKINNLHVAPLISILSRRFSNGQIYTTADSVLISLNPLRIIPGLDDYPSLYIDLPDVSDGEIPSRQALRPHVYAIANAALSKMAATNKSSSIVVAGESGSGKTEAVKRCMRFLIQADAEMSTGPEGKGAEVIKDRISTSNILFESFGNAMTIRNKNSSRFGRYIKIQYDNNQRLTSAAVQTFLLEKSRIGTSRLASGERCYHVFYAMLQGLQLVDATTATALNLSNQPATSFVMLTDTLGVAHAAAEEDDAFLLPNICSALAAVGTTEEEMRELWQLLGVLLHLGNVRFGEAAEEGKIDSPLMSILQIAGFLKLDSELLTKALTQQVLQAGGRTSVHTKILSPAEAVYNLQALIRFLYQAVFDWVVKKVNASFSTEAQPPTEPNRNHPSPFIGLLDIFGFEILQTNSLEQLLINFTNERLQQQFNEVTLSYPPPYLPRLPPPPCLPRPWPKPLPRLHAPLTPPSPSLSPRV